MKKSSDQKPQEPVGVNTKLRSAHPWFEEAAGSAKTSALAESRKRQKAAGPKLSAVELNDVCDRLEKLQRELNPLETKRDELLARLKSHWGHTGIEEVQSTLGKTLLSLSYQFTLADPENVRKAVSDTQWLKISRRKLDALSALSEADGDKKLRTILGKNAKVAVRLSVTSPSSRRPKSGQVQED